MKIRLVDKDWKLIHECPMPASWLGKLPDGLYWQKPGAKESPDRDSMSFFSKVQVGEGTAFYREGSTEDLAC